MHISHVICCTHGPLKYVMKRGLHGGRGPPAIQGALLQLIMAFQLGLKRWANLHKSMHTTLFTSPKQAGGGTEETPPPPSQGSHLPNFPPPKLHIDSEFPHGQTSFDNKTATPPLCLSGQHPLQDKNPG